MNAWVPASEVAALMRLSARHVRRLAKVEGWQSRPRAGRGGGLEYSVTSLPADTRAALVAKAIAAQPTAATTAEPSAPAQL
ncbi:MAG: DNA-binding protein, partial [Burkholderiaceae bacterium]